MPATCLSAGRSASCWNARARHIPSWHPHGDGESRDGDPRRRVAFTIAVIALGAKMAKADGTVTRDEVAAFREVFQVPPGEEEHLRLVFDLARKSTAGFDSYARQVGRLFAGDRAVLENLLGGLFHIALADGRLCPAEDAYLREVARHFGFDAATMPASGRTTSALEDEGSRRSARHARRRPGRLPRRDPRRLSPAGA